MSKWKGTPDDQTRIQGDYTLRAEQMSAGRDGESWWWCAYYQEKWLNDGIVKSMEDAKRRACREMIKYSSVKKI